MTNCWGVYGSLSKRREVNCRNAGMNELQGSSGHFSRSEVTMGCSGVLNGAVVCWYLSRSEAIASRSGRGTGQGWSGYRQL